MGFRSGTQASAATEARRAAPRVLLTALVDLLRSNPTRGHATRGHPTQGPTKAGPAKGITLDASRGGLRIRLAQPLTPGERCLVRLRFLDGTEADERAIVVWCTCADGLGWVAGLRLVGSSSALADRVASAAERDVIAFMPERMAGVDEAS